MTESPPAAHALALKFLSGPEAGRVVPIRAPLKFGRHRDNKICLSYDDRSSRFHAEIREMAGGGFELADLGSTNGSIRGAQVLRGESAPLQAGDTFRVGSTTFLFDLLERLQPASGGLWGDETAAVTTSRVGAAQGSAVQDEAVLIVDMQASTSLGGVLGEKKMLRLKEHLFDILQRAAHRHDTAFTKQTGDGYMMTFSTLSKAVSAVRAVIGETASYNRRDDKIHPLLLRLALTFGETLCDHLGDRHGQIVNLAFRLISLPGEMGGDPGVNEATPLLATTDLVAAIQGTPWDPEPPAPTNLAPQEIKGFVEPIPVSIFQLRPDVGTTA